jgi:hypothetical protein
MLGSVIPDMDYLYQSLFDFRNYDHHYYLTHFPIFWGMLLVSSQIWLFSNNKSEKPVYFFIFSLNGFLHMLLDTIEGRMYWLAPFSYQGFSGSKPLLKYAGRFVDTYPNWIYFIETLIFTCAIYLFLRGIHTKQNPLIEADSIKS